MKALQQKLVLILSILVISTPMVSAQQANQPFVDLIMNSNIFHEADKHEYWNGSIIGSLRAEIWNYVNEKFGVSTENGSFWEKVTEADKDKAYLSRLSNLTGTWLDLNGDYVAIYHIAPNGTGYIILDYWSYSGVGDLPKVRIYKKATVTRFNVKQGEFWSDFPAKPYKWFMVPADKAVYNKMSLRLKNEIDQKIARENTLSNQYSLTPGPSLKQKIEYVGKDIIILSNGIWIRESAARPLIEKAIEQAKIRREEAAKKAAEEAEKEKRGETVYRAVEQQAEFPGGSTALSKYLSEHIKYPEGETEEGRVYVEFIIQKDGSIKDVKVTKGLTPDLDAEAIRVVKSMPRWAPGKNNGKAVISIFQMPIRFKMPRD